jgi:hypothetical protein
MGGGLYGSETISASSGIDSQARGEQIRDSGVEVGVSEGESVGEADGRGEGEGVRDAVAKGEGRGVRVEDLLKSKAVEVFWKNSGDAVEIDVEATGWQAHKNKEKNQGRMRR